MAAGSLDGCFNHHRPFDGQRRVWLHYILNLPLGNWLRRSNPEWLVLLEVTGRNRPIAGCAHIEIRGDKRTLKETKESI